MSTRPGAHPSPEEVDALLDPAGGDPAVAEHVHGCSRCHEVRTSLSHVRALLHEESLRVPVAPPDLDARIAAALTSAGPVLPSQPQVGPERAEVAAGADVVPLDSRRRRAPRWLGAAAGVAVLGGAALVTAQLVGGSTAVDSSSAGGAADSSVAEQAPTALAGPGAGLQALATGRDYGPATLPDQVDDLVADARSGAGPGEAPAAGGTQEDESPGDQSAQGSDGGAEPRSGSTLPAALGPLSTPAGVDECLAALGAGGQVPLAVDLATYQGEPAAVIVLPSTRGGVDVWVVSRTCTTGADGVQQFTHLDR